MRCFIIEKYKFNYEIVQKSRINYYTLLLYSNKISPIPDTNIVSRAESVETILYQFRTRARLCVTNRKIVANYFRTTSSHSTRNRRIDDN